VRRNFEYQFAKDKAFQEFWKDKYSPKYNKKAGEGAVFIRSGSWRACRLANKNKIDSAKKYSDSVEVMSLMCHDHNVCGSGKTFAGKTFAAWQLSCILCSYGVHTF
jgi:hypothetical protein